MGLKLDIFSPGTDVPETEAGSRKGEAPSRAGTLQEVPDPAAGTTLAQRQPLQGLPSQVTPTRRPNDPAAHGHLSFLTDTHSSFPRFGPHGPTEEAG